MSQIIEEARKLLQSRLGELDAEQGAITVERQEIEESIAALPSPNGNGPVARVTAPPKRRGPGRPPGSGKGRKRRSGTRADQAVALVEKRPGISASEIAKELKIKPNYLYRVLGELEKAGRVSKKGREYHPAK